MSYDGFLTPYKEEIIASYARGRTPREIADDLQRRKVGRWGFGDGDLLANVRYILRREGIMEKPPEHPMPEPDNAPDDMSIAEWLASQDEADWPPGCLARCTSLLRNDDQFKTIGELRSASDRDLLMIPNFGKVSLRALRARLYVTQRTPKPHAADDLRLEVERLRGENQALRYALELLTNKVLPCPPEPVS